MLDPGEKHLVTGLGVSIDALGFIYPCGTKALDNICLRVEPGKSLGVVGPNGAGKSSLVQQICGFSLPTSGEIRIGDVSVSRNSLPLVRTLIGVVFQNADDQLFQPTVLEDVAFGLHNMGVGADEAELRARHAGIIRTCGHTDQSAIPPFERTEALCRAVRCACDGVESPGARRTDIGSRSSQPPRLDGDPQRATHDTLGGVA